MEGLCPPPWLQRGTDTIFDSGKARRAVPPREPEATPACAIVRMRSGNERRQLGHARDMIGSSTVAQLHRPDSIRANQ